jgi:phage terminase large subunit-like protein
VARTVLDIDDYELFGPRARPADPLDELLSSGGPSAEDRARYDWRQHGRAEQQEPPGEWRYWLYMAGRGTGKTRTLAETARLWAHAMPGSWGMIAAATAEDTASVVLGGQSGIMQTSPPWFRPRLAESRERGTFLTWPNGSRAFVRSAAEPDRFRGPQFTWACVDELAAWAPKKGQHAWDQLLAGLRLLGPRGERTRCMIATTPRPVPHVQRLAGDPGTVISRGRMRDNLANLDPAAVADLERRYGGTRLGRQELDGELLDDTAGALLSLDQISAHRVDEAPRSLTRAVVAVDPAATSNEESDETGIVAAGLARGDEGYVLADESGRYPPEAWGERSVLLHDRLDADAIVAESNQGGEMVEHVIRGAAEALHRAGRRASRFIEVRLVHARRGKETRAQPVSALYAQGRVHHVGVLRELEDQWATWVPGQGASPDRVDACVYALTELMLGASVLGEDGARALREAFAAPPKHVNAYAGRRW